MHADWLTGVDKENVLRRKNWMKKLDEKKKLKETLQSFKN